MLGSADRADQRLGPDPAIVAYPDGVGADVDTYHEEGGVEGECEWWKSGVEAQGSGELLILKGLEEFGYVAGKTPMKISVLVKWTSGGT